MPLEPGTRLGPYEILEPLGQGGMADVYRAHDSRLGRQVAIKVATEQFTDRFAREARAVAALNHPNICTLYDVGPDYLIMEVVDGPTLGEHLARSGPLSAGVATARNCSMWRPIDRSSPSTSARFRGVRARRGDYSPRRPGSAVAMPLDHAAAHRGWSRPMASGSCSPRRSVRARRRRSPWC